MPLPDRAQIDALLREEAARQGFIHPEDAPLLADRGLLQYSRETGQPMNVEHVIRELRRERPSYLDTTGSGVPEGIAGTSVHGTEGVPDRMGRLHDPATGRVLPKEPESEMTNDVLRAAFRGGAEEHAERLARITTAPDQPPGPTDEQMNEAARRIVKGEPGSSDTPAGALRDMRERQGG